MRQNVKYCGQDLPHRFDSSRNTLEIRFKSDGENGRRGFKLQYSLQSKKLFSSHISNEIIKLTLFLGCNETYSETSGRLYSPQWPYSTPSNTNCEFVLNVPGDSTTISVYPRVFHIRTNDANCTNSYLEVPMQTTLEYLITVQHL